MATRCTQWPTSAFGSGMPSERRPRLIGCQVAPASSERNAPAAEIATEALRVRRIEQDRVQAHAAGARLPVRARAVTAQPGQLVPRRAAVRGPEQRRVLDPGVHGVGIGVRGLEVPHARELPGMRRAVVPLVRARHAVVGELVADRLPGLAAVVGALHDLPEPAAGLRRPDAARVRGRALDVIDLPAAEVRPVDAPALTLAVGRQHERALACPDQYAYPAHSGSSRCSILVSSATRTRAASFLVERRIARSTARCRFPRAARDYGTRDSTRDDEAGKR
jgi:hypothetical protein